jgi:hypothetical protein
MAESLSDVGKVAQDIASHALQGTVAHIKDHVKSVLRISSAHNKGGPTDINKYKHKNTAQILHLSNFFELKRTLVYIHLQ